MSEQALLELLEEAQDAIRRVLKYNGSVSDAMVDTRGEWLTEAYEAVSNAHFLINNEKV